MLSKKLLDQLRKYFPSQQDVIAVYLYGSHARKEANKKSDIDLAVLFDETKRLPSSWGGRHVNMMVKLKQLLGVEIDVQDFSLIDINFVHRVLTEGKLIFSNNEQKRADFEVESLNKYFDLKPLYQNYYQVLSERARKGLIGRFTLPLL